MTLYCDGEPCIDVDSEAIHNGVSGISDLEDIPASERFPFMVIFVESEGTFYYWDSADTSAPLSPSVIKPDDVTLPDPGRWLQLPVGGGGSFPLDVKKIDFTFGTVSPLTIRGLSLGNAVMDSEVVITTPFDGVGAVISLGSNTDVDAVIAGAMINPAVVTTYSQSTNYVPTGADNLKLYITPSGSTQGAGYVMTLFKV